MALPQSFAVRLLYGCRTPRSSMVLQREGRRRFRQLRVGEEAWMVSSPS